MGQVGLKDHWYTRSPAESGSPVRNRNAFTVIAGPRAGDFSPHGAGSDDRSPIDDEPTFPEGLAYQCSSAYGPVSNRLLSRRWSRPKGGTEPPRRHPVSGRRRTSQECSWLARMKCDGPAPCSQDMAASGFSRWREIARTDNMFLSNTGGRPHRTEPTGSAKDVAGVVRVPTRVVGKGLLAPASPRREASLYTYPVMSST